MLQPSITEQFFALLESSEPEQKIEEALQSFFARCSEEDKIDLIFSHKDDHTPIQIALQKRQQKVAIVLFKNDFLTKKEDIQNAVYHGMQKFLDIAFTEMQEYLTEDLFFCAIGSAFGSFEMIEYLVNKNISPQGFVQWCAQQNKIDYFHHLIHFLEKKLSKKDFAITVLHAFKAGLENNTPVYFVEFYVRQLFKLNINFFELSLWDIFISHFDASHFFYNPEKIHNKKSILQFLVWMGFSMEEEKRTKILASLVYTDIHSIVAFKPQYTETFGNTPLHFLLRKKLYSLEQIQELINPQTVNTQDAFGFTPLHIAAQNGDRLSVLYLLEQGADPTVRTHAGFSVKDMIGLTNSIQNKYWCKDALRKRENALLIIYNALPKEAANNFVCPLTKNPYIDPVFLHTPGMHEPRQAYERSKLAEILGLHPQDGRLVSACGLRMLMQNPIVSAQEQFICPLTQENLQNPVLFNNHVYEKDAITECLAQNGNKDPLTRVRQPGSPRLYTPSLNFMRAMDSEKTIFTIPITPTTGKTI